MAWKIGVDQKKKMSRGESDLQVRSGFIRLLFPLMIASFTFDRLRVHPDIGISMQRVFYAIIFSVMVVLLLTRRRLRIFPFSSVLVSLMMFNIALFFSLPFSVDVSISATAVFSLVQLSLAGVVVGVFLCNFLHIYDIRLLAKTLSWLTIVGSLTIITDYFGLTNFREWYIPDSTLARQMGILGEPNFAAGKLAIGLPFILWALLEPGAGRRFFLIAIYTAGLGLAIVAVILTGSRMGIFMYAVLFLLIIARKQVRLISPGVMILIGLLVVSLSLLLRGPFGEMLDLTISRLNPLWSAIAAGQELEEMSAILRLKALETGMLIFRDYPLFGVGMDGYRIIAGDYNFLLTGRYAHNTYVEILTGVGLFGFIPFVALLISMIKSLSFMQEVPGTRGLHFFFGFSFLMLLIHLVFLSDYSNRYIWGLFLPLSLYLEWLRLSMRRHNLNR